MCEHAGVFERVCVPLVVTAGRRGLPLGGGGVPQCKSCSDVTFQGVPGESNPVISHAHRPGCSWPRFFTLEASAELSLPRAQGQDACMALQEAG